VAPREKALFLCIRKGETLPLEKEGEKRSILVVGRKGRERLLSS